MLDVIFLLLVCSLLRQPLTGADDGTRTHDLILTKDVLYRLSYISTLFLTNTSNSIHRPGA